jgi:outer membrane protein assembly factor BamB
MLTVCAGCHPLLEQSDTATMLPALLRDPVLGSQQAENWPGWRGLGTAGISLDPHLPVQWSADEHIAWRVGVPGVGKSSPVIWGENILLTSAIGQGAAPQLSVLCYHRADGKLKWQSSVGTAKDSRYTINGLAAATVATDGTRIVASFGSNGLFCFDFEGRQLWHVDLGSRKHAWGLASSPVIWGDLVIQLSDSEDHSFLAAFHKADGRQMWRNSRDSYGSWCTPALVTTGPRQTELIVNGAGTADSGGGYVISYDPASGKEIWRVQGTTNSVWPSIIPGHGIVYSTSGRNGPTLAIELGGSGEVTADHVAWRLSHSAPYVPTGVAYRNRLYLISDSGVLTCYNAGNGDEIWRQRLPGTYSASLVAGDGKIYATSERGTVYVISASDKYQLLSSNEMKQRSVSTPAISRSELFLRTETHLYCIPSPGPPLLDVVEKPSETTDAASVPSPSDRDAAESPESAKNPTAGADSGQAG